MRILDGLRRQHGVVEPPPPRNAFELVLWEKVAYLASDERRATAFEHFRKTIGATPERILAARRSAVVDALEKGGIAALERANHLIEAAEFVVGELGGRLDDACALPLRDAMRLLKRIYGIGDPGAEKILLLTRAHPVLGLDSNGLRVLQRLGYGTEGKTYNAAYKAATSAALLEIGADIDRLTTANLLLRRHGQTLCKTSSPKCGACAVSDDCPSASLTRISESVSRARTPRPAPPAPRH